MATRDSRPGTEDLEKGMHPSPASSVIVIAAIVVAALLIFNSRALVDWARQPNNGPVVARFEPAAVAWHDWMVALGPAAAFENLRSAIQKAIAR